MHIAVMYQMEGCPIIEAVDLRQALRSLKPMEIAKRARAAAHSATLLRARAKRLHGKKTKVFLCVGHYATQGELVEVNRTTLGFNPIICRLLHTLQKAPAKQAA